MLSGWLYFGFSWLQSSIIFPSSSNQLLSIKSLVMTTSATRTTTTTLRRSARLQSIVKASLSATSPEPEFTNTKKRKIGSKRATTTTATTKGKNEKKRLYASSVSKSLSSKEVSCLPRNEEMCIISSSFDSKIQFVVGVDEAGRGPLAGPVVVAAAIVPVDIDGITDSKKISKEDDREHLYKAIIESSDVRWAVAVMDAPFIDRVNILQATMRGMTAATSALITGSGVQLNGDIKVPKIPIPTIKQEGCYVITNNDGIDIFPTDKYFAVVDGNRIPTDMPCESKFIVKGDSKEYAIAAASILAKVTRDRLMRDYDKLWPQFGLQQHKGYPTAAHMQAVKVYGASPIHRRTFRPLKDMTFDKDGNVLTKKLKT